MMMKWISEVWREKIFVFDLKLRTLLVLDNATTHKTSKVKNQRMWYIVVNDSKWANMKITAFRISINKVLKVNFKKM